MSKKRYGETIPVRFTKATKEKIGTISRATGLNKSDVIRLAINSGLPGLEAGRITLGVAA